MCGPEPQKAPVQQAKEPPKPKFQNGWKRDLEAEKERFEFEDQSYLDFLAQEYQGDDISKQDMLEVIKVIKSGYGDDDGFQENEYLAFQHMNDMVLLQSFIGKRVQKQIQMQSSEDGGVKFNSRKDFPELGMEPVTRD